MAMAVVGCSKGTMRRIVTAAPYAGRLFSVILSCFVFRHAGSYIPSSNPCCRAADKPQSLRSVEVRNRGATTTTSSCFDALRTHLFSRRSSACGCSNRPKDQESGLESSSSQSSVESKRHKKAKPRSRRLRIVRLGAKPYHPDSSFPLALNSYTTRKNSHAAVAVTAHGIAGDYNHYRNVALHNATDRAVSIVTRSTIEHARAHGFPVQPGDLGENLLVEGADSGGGDGGSLIGALRPGTILQVVPSGASSLAYFASGAVLLQISEPMVPCANLCALPYIRRADDAAATPRQRVEACQSFLEILDRNVGLRGWYARVLQPGELHVGDEFRIIEA